MTTDTTTTTTVDTSYENEAGEVFRLLVDETGWQIVSNRNGTSQPEARGDAGTEDRGRATLDRWRRMHAGDPDLLGEPEGHESLSAYLTRGGNPSEHPFVSILVEYMGGKADPGRRAEQLVRVRQTIAVGTSDPMALVIPLAIENRTDEEKVRDGRRAHSHGLWALEVLADDEVADRFEAGLNAKHTAALAEERRVQAELAEAEARPFVATVENLDTYRCGSGERHSGPAVVLRARGSWIAEEAAEIEDLLVFSPAALRAILGV